ncbi:Na+/H+ antiporter [Chitinophaga silvatica]|uniref:Na+/H+ antiporter n=1 Tax=Chitinophaga silvatica TaxID=2282649 RepID=A0A3E1YAL9_9BACT|nr:Na+/H+ antiporter [Chitinophaga silvatica]RFS22725.1 Na+/H+ antiporter [Chitinophaga silvatica]
MIHQSLLLILSLFFAMALLYLLSQRLKISYPIFLVIGGLAIGLVPGLPRVSITPDLVFLIFLPPLLFDAAWSSNWDQLWKWRRSILTLGIGLVLVTSAIVAHYAVLLIPGFTLALGYLLGGIISPPDAVAATSVLKGSSVPKRGLAILEGESLVNDAVSLTVFRFAIAAIITGKFVVQDALIQFFELAVMGIFVGLLIGHFLYLVIRYWVKSSSITTPITLIAPYLMYMTAEEFNWSGVLAVVSGGLFLSFRSSDYLNYETRLQTKEVWQTITFLLNGFVFILIGLELPTIVSGINGYTPSLVVTYALLISALIIVIRIVMVYLGAFIPRLLSKKIRAEETHPGYKLPFIVGWAGMRGVVSLASALAIPLTVHSGENFPERNLIIFITFVVILVTLVFQGLTLPLFIKWLKVEEVDPSVPPDEQIAAIRLLLSKQSIEYLDTHYAEEMMKYSNIAGIREQYLLTVTVLENSIQDKTKAPAIKNARKLYKKIMLEILNLRRQSLRTMRAEKKYDDEVFKFLESNLDLEEARLYRS